MEVPESIVIEHKEIHGMLAKALKAGGETAKAAKAVEEVLHPHFIKEEEYALPQLGLLKPLSEGKTIKNANDALRLSEKLNAELKQMLTEHKSIVEKLDELIGVATKESKKQPVEFAEKLKMHAHAEEEIYYPAAILVGEYLKAKKQ